MSSGMKSMMKSVKKRLSTEASKAAWESDPGKEKEGYIRNKSLPRCRRAREISSSVLVTTLPNIRDASPSMRKKLLIRKLRLCCYVFTFSDVPDTPHEAKLKEIKRSALLELVNYLTVFKPSFTEIELKEIFEMLACNLFRPLPPTMLDIMGMYNPEEDEPQSEPTWPHLQVVYEFLLRLATSTETDSKLLDKFFTRSFVLNLLELFDSEDPRERDYLKTILHRIYGNFMGLRPFVRRAINNVFYKFIYETDRHNGIAELLEILGSIINGFALPLKEQHKQFLQRVLLPLHKTTYVGVFHPQLSYCVTQFLEKDATLAPKIIMSALKFWPATSSKKELMFLNELEEILDRIQSHHLGEAQVPLFRQIGKSINSPHFQVSERAIYVLNNDVILRFITNNREVLVPILSRSLYSNTFLQQSAENKELKTIAGYNENFKWQEMGHWNPTIVELTADILKLFNEMDSNLMARCNKTHGAKMKKSLVNIQARKEHWIQLEKEADKKRPKRSEESKNNTTNTASSATESKKKIKGSKGDAKSRKAKK